MLAEHHSTHQLITAQHSVRALLHIMHDAARQTRTTSHTLDTPPLSSLPAAPAGSTADGIAATRVNRSALAAPSGLAPESTHMPAAAASSNVGTFGTVREAASQGKAQADHRSSGLSSLGKAGYCGGKVGRFSRGGGGFDMDAGRRSGAREGVSCSSQAAAMQASCNAGQASTSGRGTQDSNGGAAGKQSRRKAAANASGRHIPQEVLGRSSKKSTGGAVVSCNSLDACSSPEATEASFRQLEPGACSSSDHTPERTAARPGSCAPHPNPAEQFAAFRAYRFGRDVAAKYIDDPRVASFHPAGEHTTENAGRSGSNDAKSLQDRQKLEKDRLLVAANAALLSLLDNADTHFGVVNEGGAPALVTILQYGEGLNVCCYTMPICRMHVHWHCQRIAHSCMEFHACLMSKSTARHSATLWAIACCIVSCHYWS